MEKRPPVHARRAFSLSQDCRSVDQFTVKSMTIPAATWPAILQMIA
jgi:hypothetical protein